MYIPPNSNQQYSEDILDILEYVTNVHDSVIVMGDLNYNCMLRSDDDAYDSNISVIEQLTGLTQLVEEPTSLDIIIIITHRRYTDITSLSTCTYWCATIGIK